MSKVTSAKVYYQYNECVFCRCLIHFVKGKQGKITVKVACSYDTLFTVFLGSHSVHILQKLCPVSPSRCCKTRVLFVTVFHSNVI